MRRVLCRLFGHRVPPGHDERSEFVCLRCERAMIHADGGYWVKMRHH